MKELLWRGYCVSTFPFQRGCSLSALAFHSETGVLDTEEQSHHSRDNP